MKPLPRTILRGHVRTSTAGLLAAFLAVLALWITVRPEPAQVTEQICGGSGSCVTVRTTTKGRLVPPSPTPTPVPTPAPTPAPTLKPRKSGQPTASPAPAVPTPVPSPAAGFLFATPSPTPPPAVPEAAPPLTQ